MNRLEELGPAFHGGCPPRGECCGFRVSVLPLHAIPPGERAVERSVRRAVERSVHRVARSTAGHTAGGDGAAVHCYSCASAQHAATRIQPNRFRPACGETVSCRQRRRQRLAEAAAGAAPANPHAPPPGMGCKARGSQGSQGFSLGLQTRTWEVLAPSDGAAGGGHAGRVGAARSSKMGQRECPATPRWL